MQDAFKLSELINHTYSLSVHPDLTFEGNHSRTGKVTRRANENWCFVLRLREPAPDSRGPG